MRMASYRSARYIRQHLNMLAIGTSTLTVEFDGAGTRPRPLSKRPCPVLNMLIPRRRSFFVFCFAGEKFKTLVAAAIARRKPAVAATSSDANAKDGTAAAAAAAAAAQAKSVRLCAVCSRMLKQSLNLYIISFVVCALQDAILRRILRVPPDKVCPEAVCVEPFHPTSPQEPDTAPSSGSSI